MSKVMRKGKFIRPSWNFKIDAPACLETEHLVEMTESVRNTLEQIRDSQMLQCDVAQAIKDMERQIRLLRKDVRNQGLSREEGDEH